MSAGRTAVVTGGAGAIGSAIARRLHAGGATVVLVDRAPTVHAVAATIGDRAVGVELDLVDPAEVTRIGADIVAAHGPVTVLVNNAGVHLMHGGGTLISVEDTDLATWDTTFRINVTAPLLLAQAFLPGMRAAGWGRIVNIASRAARTFTAGGSSASYAASKAALIGLTRTLAGECAKDGITANVVAPGRTETPLLLQQSAEIQAAGLAEIPRGRTGTPDEVAAAVEFLVSDAAGAVVGATLDVNGGGFIP